MKNKFQFLFPSAHELLALVFCICLLFAGGIFSLNTRHSEASDPQKFSGYAWGASSISGLGGDPGGIGWVSFNCENAGTCGAVDYAVSLNSSNYLTGSAWSSNYGWIQFGGLSLFPSGSGTVSDNARLSGNKLEGWARVCSGTVGKDCNSATKANFDGWISLSGSGYAVNMDGSGTLSGYAWGGPAIGWISFNCDNNSSCPTSDYKVGILQPGSIDLRGSTVQASNVHGEVHVLAGDTVHVTWTNQNIPDGTDCSAQSSDYPDDQWVTDTAPSSSGSNPVDYVANDDVSISISCVDALGDTVSDTLNITIDTPAPPYVDLQVYNPYTDSFTDTPTPLVINFGDQLTFGWNISGATECHATNFSPSSILGSMPMQQNFGVVNSSAVETYQITCSNIDAYGLDLGDTTDTVQVDGYDPNATCDDPAGGTALLAGESRPYDNARQARVCSTIIRTCVGGAMGGDATHTDPAVYNKYIYKGGTCTPDPNYKEQ